MKGSSQNKQKLRRLSGKYVRNFVIADDKRKNVSLLKADRRCGQSNPRFNSVISTVSINRPVNQSTLTLTRG